MIDILSGLWKPRECLSQEVFSAAHGYKNVQSAAGGQGVVEELGQLPFVGSLQHHALAYQGCRKLYRRSSCTGTHDEFATQRVRSSGLSYLCRVERSGLLYYD